MRLLVVVAIGTIGTVAHAQGAPKPEWPLAEVDRPLLLYRGMTILDISLDFETHLRTTTDPAGNTMTTATALGDQQVLDFVVAHSWGSFQLSGRIVDRLASAVIDFELPALPGTLYAVIDYFDPQKGVRYSYSQAVGYHAKARVAPGRLAIAGGCWTELGEYAFEGAGQHGEQLLQVGASGGPEIQLTRRLAIFGGASMGVPVNEPGGSRRPTVIDVYGGLVFAFRRVDVYTDLDENDLTGYRRPFANLGAVVRWGV